MLAQTVGLLEILIVLIYLLAIGYLGYMGWRKTTSAADYMLAGRRAHPFVMAMSYGATFISTSAIVGFGGVAGLFGMSILWLVFLNIFVGIFIAFVFLGGRTRRIGHHLDAHTFPELIGRRYQSKFIQVFAGLVIFILIPLYASAVLIGGCEFIAVQFDVNFEVALLIFSVLVAGYVMVGGLKGVMYTDALQGTIMTVGMLVLLVATYVMVGGLTDGHQALGALDDMAPGPLREMGHRGWTAFPEFGWGAKELDGGGSNPKAYNLWWLTVSTLILGVGIGVLAQPQLVVRFMTVNSQKQLNRAVLAGGLFILIIPGTAYVVGSLSNAYFTQNGPQMRGPIVKIIDADERHAVIDVQEVIDPPKWLVAGETEDQRTEAMKKFLGPKPVVVDADAAVEQGQVVTGRSLSIVYAGGNRDQIIPRYITSAMPRWFGLLFLLTLLAAAMSTLSSQFHAIGTSIGRDVYEQVAPARRTSERSVLMVRVGVIIGLIASVVISIYIRGNIVAKATAIFFSVSAASFLPTYVGGLFWKRATRPGAVASMVVGTVLAFFWLLFVHAPSAGPLGLVQTVTGGKPSILLGDHNWHFVDPIVAILPVSTVVFIVVSLLTKAPDEEHLNRCFRR